MKLFLMLLVSFAAIVQASGSSAPTSFNTTSAYPESYMYADVTNKDTLVSQDSTTAISARTFPQGYNYVLVVPATWTGTGSDSVEAIVRIDMFAKDTSTVASYTQVLDTINSALAAAAPGQAIDLKIGNSLFGYKAQVKFIGVTSKTGTQAITPAHYYIYAVRPVHMERKW